MKTKYEKINEYRLIHRLSIRALEEQMGLPANVLRRLIQKKTRAARDYHEAIIDTWMKKNGI